jgi:hypothetical protein
MHVMAAPPQETLDLDRLQAIGVAIQLADDQDPLRFLARRV